RERERERERERACLLPFSHRFFLRRFSLPCASFALPFLLFISSAPWAAFYPVYPGFTFTPASGLRIPSFSVVYVFLRFSLDYCACTMGCPGCTCSCSRRFLFFLFFLVF